MFASKTSEKFANVSLLTGVTGAPIIAGCLSWLDCRPFDRVDAGDHVVLVGQVEALAAGEGKPLGYWNGGYITLSLDAEAKSMQSGPSAFVGCILERDGKILLYRSEGGAWTIPRAPIEGRRRNHEERIVELLATFGLSGRSTFLYSVFEAQSEGASYIVYRAMVPHHDTIRKATHWGFFGSTELPRIDSAEMRFVIDRYFRESVTANFGIYSDVGQQGSVGQLVGPPLPWKG